MKSLKQLMESLTEAWPGTKDYEKKYGVQKSGLGSEGSDGKKSGNRHDIEAKDGVIKATRKYDRDGESREQEVKSDGSGEAPVKRGRGRPAGKYGSYKKKVKESIDFMETLDEAQLEAYLNTLDEETLAEINDALSEDAEQIEELSKSTLGSYVKKVTAKLPEQGAATRQFANDSEAARKDQNYVGARKSMEKADKTFAKSWKRRVGVGKAVDRLTKESVEQIDELSEDVEQIEELSKEKLGWYLKKASKHIGKKGDNMVKRDKKLKTGMNPLSRQFSGLAQRQDSIAQASKKYLAKEDVQVEQEQTNTIIESRGPEAIAALITKQAKEQ